MTTRLSPVGMPTSRMLLALALVGVATMFLAPYLFMLAVICGLVVGCRRYTREARRSGTDTGLAYHLCFFAVRYLIPIGVAMACYGLVSLYVSWFGDSVSIDWLITMQRTFEDISAFFAENLKLNELGVFVILAVIYLLSCVLLARDRPATANERPSFRERLVGGMHRSVEVYGKYSGPLAAGLATLASFTLFGMQLGEPSKDLHLRLKIAQQGYAEIATKTESALAERISGGLYAKIRDTFPMSYRSAFTLPTQVDQLVDTLRSNAQSARSTYGITDPAVERTLREHSARIAKVDRLGPRLRVTGDAPRSRPPGHLTPDEIATARDALKVRHGNGIQLISDGHRSLTLQVEKLVSERIMALTKPLMDAVPILEPVLQTFTEAVDKTVQDRLGKSYDRIMRAAMHDPQGVDGRVRHEAGSVVSETNVEPLVERATPLAEQQSEKLRQALSSLTASDRLIDRRVSQTLATRRSTTGPLEILELPQLRIPSYPELSRMPYSYTYRYPTSGYYGSGRYTPPRITPKFTAPRVVPRFPIIW